MSGSAFLVIDGKAWAWGSDSYGKLGVRDVDSERSTPVLIQDASSGSSWSQIASGGEETVGVAVFNGFGRLYEWGNLTNGAHRDSSSLVPRLIDIPSVTGWRKVVAGLENAYALGFNGELRGWGSNQGGILGTHWTEATLRIVAADDSLWTDVAAGGYHGLALSSDNQVFAWGWNSAGQLGTGDTITTYPPAKVQLPPAIVWKSIFCGENSSYALSIDGRLFSWGDNNYGELGVGIDSSIRRKPAEVIPPQGAGRWLSIACGGGFVIALARDSNVYSWGFNRNGTLGGGTLADPKYPTPIHVILPPGEKWQWIGASEVEGFALSTKGHLYYWGWAFRGPVDEGHYKYIYTPIMLLNLNSASVRSNVDFSPALSMIYPNPSHLGAELNLRHARGAAELIAFNILGEQVLKQSVSPNSRSERFRTDGLRAGTYTVKCGSEVSNFVLIP